MKLNASIFDCFKFAFYLARDENAHRLIELLYSKNKVSPNDERLRLRACEILKV